MFRARNTKIAPSMFPETNTPNIASNAANGTKKRIDGYENISKSMGNVANIPHIIIHANVSFILNNKQVTIPQPTIHVNPSIRVGPESYSI